MKSVWDWMRHTKPVQPYSYLVNNVKTNEVL
jgi:hypothetical protein